MGFNVCVAQPANFMHAMGWLELAELIQGGILDAGYECSLSLNQTPKDRVNIIIGIQFIDPNDFDEIPPNSILLNIEQLDTKLHEWTERIVSWCRKPFRFWDYSDANIAYLRRLNLTHVEKLHLGYTSRLCRLQRQATINSDYIFYGCLNHRRRQIIESLCHTGLIVKVLDGVFGKRRDEEIVKAKAVLNMHFYESEIFEVVRANYLFHNKIPLLSEINETSQIDESLMQCIWHAPREELASLATDLAENPKRLDARAEHAFMILSERPQADVMRDLLL